MSKSDPKESPNKLVIRDLKARVEHLLPQNECKFQKWDEVKSMKWNQSNVQRLDEFAIKRCNISDEDMSMVFWRELLALANLKGCPYIVEFCGWHVDDDEKYGYIAMPWCTSLREAISPQDLVHDHGRLARIVIEIAAALFVVHSHGFLHRDLKPENVLVDKNGDIRLADFERAREVRGTTLTQPVDGRYAYYHQVGYYTARLDVRAFGLLSIRLRTGKMTFDIDPFERVQVDADLEKWCCREHEMERPDSYELVVELCRPERIAQMFGVIKDEKLDETLRKVKRMVDEVTNSPNFAANHKAMFREPDFRAMSKREMRETEFNLKQFSEFLKGQE